MNDEEFNRLKEETIKELTITSFDFRTVTSLAQKFNINENDMRYVLISLEKDRVVRRTYDAKNRYELSQYRLVSKGFTKIEKKRRFFAMLGNAGERKIKPEWY